MGPDRPLESRPRIPSYAMGRVAIRGADHGPAALLQANPVNRLNKDC